MNKLITPIALPILVFSLFIFLLNVYVEKQNITENPEKAHWINGVVYFSLVASGYLAGKLTKNRAILLGSLVGLMCALIAITFFQFASLSLATNTTSAIIGVIAGGLGAVFSKYDTKEKNRRF